VLLAEGREAEVLLRPDGQVLKLWRQPGDGPKAEREHAVCRLLSPLAPTVHTLVEIDGRPGLIMDRIEGDSLLTQLQRRPHQLFRAARVLARVHVELNSFAAPRELPDLKDVLASRITLADTLPRDHHDLALRLLASLPPGDRLCHNDFHLGNLLGSWDAPVVIDWGWAARGDPTSDVARSDLLQRIGALPPGMTVVFRALAAVGRGLLTDLYVRQYRRLAGNEPTFDSWRFVHWAARFGDDVPEDRPRLLRLLDRAAPALSRHL
jgi:aminoglycoside phosphotransferase (APT) family kinase protein